MAHVCIITPTGMVCSSSKLKMHHRTGESCQEPYTNPQASKAQKIRDDIKPDCTPDEHELIGDVAELILAAGVSPRQQFTIVCLG
jgi:hypothetical protein